MNIATGVFDSVQNAERAFHALTSAGFGSDQVGVLVCDQAKAQTLAADLQRDYQPDATLNDVFDNRLVYCRMSSQHVDTIHASELPDQAVDWYQQHLDRGNILEVVNVGDRMADADRIIRDNGGMLYGDQEGMTRQGMMPQAGYAGTQREMDTDRGRDEVVLPLIDEEVAVEKTQRQAGEVEITTQAYSETVDLPTTVIHEEIRIERRVLDRPMSVDEYKARGTTEPGVVRMPVVVEEVRVVKRPVIREEMIVTRVPVTDRQTLHESVQHTEPHVETHGDVRVEDVTEKDRKRRPAA